MNTVTLSNGRTLHIVTERICPPIPIRLYDWSAVDDRTYDGADRSPVVGVGATERAAIDDLIEQICEREDICPPNCRCCQQERT